MPGSATSAGICRYAISATSRVRSSSVSRRHSHRARAVSDPMESETSSNSLHGRIFDGEPVSTSPENALAAFGGRLLAAGKRHDDCGRMEFRLARGPPRQRLGIGAPKALLIALVNMRGGPGLRRG